MNKDKNKGIKVAVLSILLAVLMLMPAVFVPTKSQAFAPDVVAVNVGKWVWERIQDVIGRAVTIVGSNVINSALDTYINNLSYELANHIASGAIGGKPLFRTSELGASFNKARDAAYGQFITELSEKNFKDLGINLCDPTLNIKLTLSLTLIDAAAPDQPKCNWREVQQNWRQFSDSLSGGKWTDFIKFQLDPRQSGSQGLEDFFESFSLANSDLGALTLLYEEQVRRAQEAKDIAAKYQLLCQGYKDKTTVVTGEVLVTCQQNKAIAEEPIHAATQADQGRILSEKHGVIVTNIGDVLRRAFGTFTRTLSGKLMEHYIQRGMWSLTQLLGNDQTDLRTDLLTLLRGGADLRAPRGTDIFRDLKTVDIQEVENYNLLEDFAICPNQADFRSPDNCTISIEFLQLLPQRKTIQQAIADGSLNGSLPFIGPGDPRNNSDTCYLEGLCYHNLVKLRKAGVVPVGWEMAALRAPIGTSVTLDKAINCFEDEGCVYNPHPDYDNHNPYYHLIDPNWVLKAPEVRCNALVYGPVLESSESNSRQQYCADIQTCLQEDGQGNCLDGQFGYCTRSENIWRFNGDICEDGEVYSGCLTFANDQSGASSYLENSLDYCDSDQVGCQRYAQLKDENAGWLLEGDMTLDTELNQTDLFLNNQAANCPPDKEGCREFIVMAANRGINLLPNGGFDYFKGLANDGTADEVLGWDSSGSLEIITSPSNSGQAVEVSNSINTTIETGVPLRNRTFVVSFYAEGSSNLSISLAVFGRRSITDNRGLSSDGNRIVVSGTFDDDVEDTAFTLSLTTAGNFILDEVKLEETDTFSYIRDRRSAENISTNFTNYGDGGRILMDAERFMCVAEEVGCRGYSPLNGDPLIPGIVGPGDVCPVECVGYATFAEQPSIFDIYEGDNNADYYNFIPTTASSCPSQAIGCEEFTNLDEVAQGGEGREYYTYIRQCVPEANGTTYYTWEGQDVAGYQLTTHLLLESNLGNAPCTNVEPGGNTCIDEPYDEFGANPHSIAACGADTPDYPLDDPEYDINCREYYDTEGGVHYRFQDRVIISTDDCRPYRRTLTGQEYQAVAALSQSCQAQFAGCRAYSGAAANNQRRIFIDNFENGSFSPWYAEVGGGTLDLSNESLANNGHSVKITGSDYKGFARPLTNFQNNKSYQLSFWMKNEGTIDSITVSFTDGLAHSLLLGTINTVSAGQWRRYEITSQNIIDLETNSVTLRIGMNGQGAVYVDNIILKELADSLSFVHNSWQTPASCDSPFAGAYLGCQAYRDTNGQQYNLKSFTSLCRQEAIGCMAVIDTQNSTSPFEQRFNAGDYSEITVPEDDVTYLVPDVEKYCASAYKGCSALGKPIVNRVDNSITGFSTVYKLNNPDNYNSSLCQSDNLYCEEYSSDKGTYYFRNPGNKTCSYQEDVNVGGELIDGWFVTDSLVNGPPEACDADYDLAFGWAGSCPSSKNLCTTFIDPADPLNCDFNNTNSDPDVPNCKAYYYYDNDKIDGASCNGQVDQQTGCILAYDVNNWNADHSEVITLYDTEVTYNNNVAQNRPVNPDTGGGAGGAILDANRIIKVNKDRQCAEWLACKSLSAVFNEDTSQYEMVCDALDSCTEYSATSNITQCRKWSSYTPDKPLTIEEYQSRVTGISNHLQWSDKEYISYSIPNLFPLKDLLVIDFATTTEYNDPRLVYDPSDYYPDGSCTPAQDNQACNITINEEGYDGICRDQVCWINPTGSSASHSPYTVTTRGFASQQSPYPSDVQEDDGVTVRKNKYNQANVCENGDDSCEPAYKKITYGLGSLVRYYSAEAFAEDNYATGVCSVVDSAMTTKQEGDDCLPNIAGNNANINTCGVTGRCEAITKIEDFINWEGICLQPDLSRNIPSDLKSNYYCNMWYPAQQIIGSQSRFNHYVEAGFYNPAGQNVNMCTLTVPYQLTEDRLYCARWDNSGCNVLMLIPAGAQVNVSQVAARADLLDATNPHWLEVGQYSFMEASNPSNPLGTEVVWPPTRGLGEKFNLINFNYSSTPSITIADVEALFYTPASLGRQIKRYYYDQGVNTQGVSSGGFVSTENSASISGRRCADGLCSGESCAQDIASSGDNNYCANNNSHLVNYHCSSGTTCHLFDEWDNCNIICNPLRENYYVLSETSVVNSCQGSDCSGPSKGTACMLTRPEFSSLYNTWSVGSMNDINDCGSLGLIGNDLYSCWFVYCVANVEEILQSNGVPFYNLCEQYSNNFGYYSAYPFIPANYRELGSANCASYMFLNNGGVTTTPTSIDLAQEAFGVGSIGGLGLYGASSDGCLVSDVPSDQFCVSYSLPGYPASSVGTICNNTDCVQQCQSVSVVDAEGNPDRSWVRTDIWWRAKNRLNNGHMGSWNSYYFSNTSNAYTRDQNVLYDAIATTEIGPFFGADQGLASNEIITVQTPVNSPNFGLRSAATFFSNNSIGAAAGDLRYLFARIYNLTWDGNSYPIISATTLDTPFNPNTFAGTDYDPRLLQVCGNEYCDEGGAVNPRTGITVNNQNTAIEIVGDEGNLFSAIKFYYYAHPDHMPVTDLRVDWGDGYISGGLPNSKYKNNLAICDPEEIAPDLGGSRFLGFGGTADACHEGYKTFFHFYVYDDLDFANRCSARGVAGHPSSANCYRPSVTVTDNWNRSTTTQYGGWMVVYEPIE